MGTATHRRRCFSPSPLMPSSSSPELLLPPSVSSSSASLLRCRYVSSPRPLLPMVARPPIRITSSTSRCSNTGRHSSPPPPPRIGLSNLWERRESTPICELPRGECDDALQHPLSTGAPYSAHDVQKLHGRANAGCAADGLTLAKSWRWTRSIPVRYSISLGSACKG
jgi:hypothetical protein